MSEEFEVEQVAVEAEPVEVVVEPEVEAVAEVEVEVEAPVKTSTRKPKVAESVVEVDAIPPVEASAAPVSNGPVVHMRALVYSATRKNSESVAVLQRRLSDVGYPGARGDMRGWFHDKTRATISKWQEEHGLEVTGTCEFDDMRYLFDGTDVEIVS